MSFVIEGNVAEFDVGEITRCIEVCGNVIHVFDRGVKLDELVKLDFEPQQIKTDKAGNIKVGKYTVIADGVRVTVKDGEGKPVYCDYSGDATVYEAEKDFSLAALEGHRQDGARVNFRTQINIALGADDKVYGLGDKAAQIDRRGYKYIQWNNDDPSQHNESYKSLYKSINYALISGENGYVGVFYPDPHRVTFDLGAYKPDLMYIASEHGGYDYFIIVGTPREITRAYTALVGRPLLPRLKMLGYQQSRWSYATQAEVEELVDAFDKNDIPLDYVHLDIDYMDGYRVYTVDKAKFPDIRALSTRLKKSGVELVTILDPGVKADDGYFVYRKLIEGDWLAKQNGAVYHNAVWPGDSVYPNYFNEKASELVAKLTSDFMKDTGVTGIWCDMNEPASFNGPLPDDVMFGKYPHSRVHNLYGEYMVRAVCKAFNDSGMRPFVITRACFATSAPFTTVWNGDNQSLWAHLRASLPQISTMNICGFPLDGVDIGGFGNECTKELLVRWIQANIFSPFLRNHAALHTRAQEPYAFDGEALAIFKKFLRLRYEFAPYLYDLAHVAHDTGEPIVRPMFYAFPTDRECARISDQVMIGDSLMLAPALDSGVTHRSVYFPKGEWKPLTAVNADVKTHKQGIAAVPVPLDSAPLYINSRSIVPVYRGLKNLDEKPDELVVLLGGGPAEYVTYEDDGKTPDCPRSSYKLTYDGSRFSFTTLENAYATDYKTVRIIAPSGDVAVVPMKGEFTLNIK